MARVKILVWESSLFLLASPVLLLLAVRRGLRKIRFFTFASRVEVHCECGAAVALLGLWRCSCGFTYQGHLVSVCPVCGALPKIVRCYQCGVTRRLPDPW